MGALAAFGSSPLLAALFLFEWDLVDLTFTPLSHLPCVLACCVLCLAVVFQV